MTIQIQSRNERGSALHTFDATDIAGAADYIVGQASVHFVDGFTVGGFGIVRVQRDTLPVSYTWLRDGAFVGGDADALREAMRQQYAPGLGQRYPRTF